MGNDKIGAADSSGVPASTAQAIYLDAQANDFCLVGTPEQMAEKLDSYVDAGVRRRNFRLAPQGIHQEVSPQTNELFPRR